MSVAVASFAVFAASQVGTPGPANMALLATGARYGLRAALPFVLGVVSSSMLLVFPVALVSPRSDFTEGRGTGKRASAHVKCPKCGVSNAVESDVRPLRLECSGCESTLRLE